MSAEYAEYLRSNHWRAVRRRYQASKLPWRCYICGADKRLDLHHKTYKRFGNENLHDLIPLCRPCHNLVHLAVRNGAPLWSATKAVKRTGKVTLLPDDPRLDPDASAARAYSKRNKFRHKKTSRAAKGVARVSAS